MSIITSSDGFDEKLSIAVERFPVIYDKKNKDFKDKLIVENAWKEVISEVGLESIERGKKMFENLRKRYTRRRNAAKKGPSGTDAASVKEANEKMKDVMFLSWLEPYIKTRATKTNLKALVKEAANEFSSEEEEGSDDSDDGVSVSDGEDRNSDDLDFDTVGVRAETLATRRNEEDEEEGEEDLLLNPEAAEKKRD